MIRFHDHCRHCLLTIVSFVALAAQASAAGTQTAAPKYETCRLDLLFPAGAQAGQSVKVEFQGTESGMEFAKAIVVDGPPGITATEFRPIDVHRVEVTLKVAADALPGRRAVRVVSERAGTTNLAWFTVGRLPEVNETEPNNEPAAAQAVTAPLTINGRINPQTDVDCYRFAAKAGQKLVAAVQAHAFDAHGHGRNYGIIDTQLKVLDAAGRVVGEAQDTLGLDPVVAFTVPADGEYTACVQQLGFDGSHWAVYRLSLGEIPYPTHAFPSGGRRGEKTSTRLFGWNLPPDGQLVELTPGEGHYPLEAITTGGPLDTGHEVPFLRGDFPELIEQEPNNDKEHAQTGVLPQIINGRFETPGDADWFRLELKDTTPVWLEIFGHRFLRSPIDTLLQVYDANGQMLQEADEGVTDPGYESYHDFRTPDSRMVFTPKQPGVYFVRVSETNGSSGPRTVYRLLMKPALPDFELVQFPDAVPIWGPGSSASLLVKVERFGGLTSDIELSVEGLPAGWKGSRFINAGEQTQRMSYYAGKQFLTITAPPDSKPGDFSEFRIVGRAQVDGQTIERIAYPLSLFYTSDTGFFRISPVARTAVVLPQGPTLQPEVTEVTVRMGETASVPVRVIDDNELKEISLTANVAHNGVACSLDAPATVPIQDGRAICPIKLPDLIVPGTYSLVIARSWRSDIRTGMPGPCTPVMLLKVLPKAK